VEAPPPPPAPEPEPEIAPPAPPPQPATVDFVCEADVREAIAKKRKIFVHRKSIVTPSARDLAAPSDILVMVRG